LLLKSRTLFVVGAGASFEVGFPVGRDLKAEIAARLDIKFEDGFAQSSGDRELTAALHELVRRQDGQRGDINPWLHKAWQMSDALPQAVSIDNYIDAREDPEIAELGKLAIVRSIAQAERRSSLFFDNEGSRVAAISNAANTHYHSMFQLLSEGLRTSSAGSIFDHVGIISFNYDRSLEWYLVNAIANFFAMPIHLAEEILGSLQIVHPYGTLGPLPTSSGRRSGAVGYGSDVRSRDLVSLARTIHTFTEQLSDPTISSQIEAQVTAAEHIVFLGFGYHDINMQTLATTKKTSLRRVFGTALGVSKSDLEAIGLTIRMAFQGIGPDRFADRPDIQLRSDLKCAGIFDEYGRSLRA
jgi:hypothetical protein